MKILKLFLYASILLLILPGCNDEDNVTNPPDNAPVEDDIQNNATDNLTNTDTMNNDTTNDDSTVQDETLFNFTNFDLDVKYTGNKEFDVEYENELDGMEAEIKDDLNNEKLSGDEAFERLRPIFEKMTFNKDTKDADVISEVLNAFNLNKNYIEFELDVKYLDGTEKEYNN